MLVALRQRLTILSLCAAVCAGAALAPITWADTPAPAASAKKAKAPAQPIDINVADEAELQTIPGIGEATARLIVEWREANGPFRRVEDLMKVKGIGEKSLEKLRPYVRVAKEK